MRRLRDLEARAAALLRARWRLLAVAAVASLGTAGAFSVGLAPEDRTRAILEVLTFGAVLLPLIAGHGMIAGSLRSGAALLWLQKPVHPVAFFAGRALDITGLSVALVLALWGAGAWVATLSLGPEAGREVLATVPGALLVVVSVCVMLYAFSAWGIPTDSLFVIAFLFASVFSALAGGVAAEVLTRLALPVEAISTLTRFLAGRAHGDVGEASLSFARFLAIWIALGTLGLALSTRSPIPREVSR